MEEERVTNNCQFEIEKIVQKHVQMFVISRRCLPHLSVW